MRRSILTGVLALVVPAALTVACQPRGGGPVSADETAAPVAVAGTPDRPPTLEEAAKPAPSGRLSLDTLSGTEWVLRVWTSDEPAPTEPEVTLVVAEGRFAGSNGCNRYFAQVTAGAAPGEVSLGPVGSTKMRCPDPAGAVESRFMAQLGGVTRFELMMGRLALTYEVGGEHGVMLFEARTPPGAAPL